MKCGRSSSGGVWRLITACLLRLAICRLYVQDPTGGLQLGYSRSSSKTQGRKSLTAPISGEIKQREFFQ